MPADRATTDVFWPRAILHVDMNAFFAAIEQLDFPALRARPIAVTNGMQGTCIITCSYEARRYGVHTGMRMKEARRRCPALIQRPARPKRYVAISTRIMHALQDITPDVEVFSVDEAFLDITACQRLWGPPAVIARLVKQKVHEISELRCSVGVSGDKTTAKYAAELIKPDGLTLIPPWESAARLRHAAVTELCGINQGIARFLAAHGAYTCGDVARLPVSVLARRFGNAGRRIWYMCQGADPAKVETTVAPPKSIGHGKVVPPGTRDRDMLLTYLLHMSAKVAARLRRHEMEALVFNIGLRTRDAWIGGRMRCAHPTSDSRPIMALCRQVMRQCWRGEGIFQVHVAALAPRPARQQQELFHAADARGAAVNVAMDAINRRYGEHTIAPGRLLRRSTMPNVISPAWKPFGPRQSIPISI